AQATIAKGIVYCSGNIGCTNEFVVVEGGVRAQTRRALENLSIVLTAAGSGLAHIVKANIYLTDMGDFQAMNEVYSETICRRAPCVAVVALPLGARFVLYFRSSSSVV
ncbi:Endoribonuclease L-PSP/chorismate mutase-like protein, partial [Mycena galericulata]